MALRRHWMVWVAVALIIAVTAGTAVAIESHARPTDGVAMRHATQDGQSGLSRAAFGAEPATLAMCLLGGISLVHWRR